PMLDHRAALNLTEAVGLDAGSLGAAQKEPFTLLVAAPLKQERRCPSPDARPQPDPSDARLLGKLPERGLLERLHRVNAAAWRGPPGAALGVGGVDRTKEQHPLVVVQQQHAGCIAADRHPAPPARHYSRRPSQIMLEGARSGPVTRGSS